MALPLTLEQTEDIAAPDRPQEPEPPYPYDAEEVAFENEAAGVTLAGTLTLPRSGGPHPAVVLISGSGPQDRDEKVFGHRPFLVLADYLTRPGLPATSRRPRARTSPPTLLPPSPSSKDAPTSRPRRSG
jgi:hypothetical protein